MSSGRLVIPTRVVISRRHTFTTSHRNFQLKVFERPQFMNVNSFVNLGNFEKYEAFTNLNCQVAKISVILLAEIFWYCKQSTWLLRFATSREMRRPTCDSQIPPCLQTCRLECVGTEVKHPRLVATLSLLSVIAVKSYQEASTCVLNMIKPCVQR